MRSFYARAMLRNLVETGIASEQSDAKLMMPQALSEKALAPAPKELRDQLRAAIFKNMLLVLNTYKMMEAIIGKDRDSTYDMSELRERTRQPPTLKPS
jgi:hypothetical protein